MLAKELLPYLDLTSLGALDQIPAVLELGDKALRSGCAALCVYPRFIPELKGVKALSDLKVATVCSFPHGQAGPEMKREEARFLIELGVDEIDMVSCIGALLEEGWDTLHEEVKGVKDVCGDKVLKVILETSLLESKEGGEKIIRKASRVACEAGCDFLKTSTGKEAGGASARSVTIFAEEAKRYFLETGRRVGIKPSGGIRKVSEAGMYAELVRSVAGEEWLSPNHFRLGASTLLDEILKEA